MNTDSLSAQHEQIGRAVVKLIAEHAANLESLPINSAATPNDLKKLFDEPLPVAGTPPEKILEQFARDIAANAQQVPSPRYFGQFNPTPLAIGVWADALCSSLNQNAGLAQWPDVGDGGIAGHSLALRIGRLWRQAFGVLASGGSEANLIALNAREIELANTGV
jgi:glutamate/tyrosine decarboxylase-like PLP-dependent enzyme